MRVARQQWNGLQQRAIMLDTPTMAAVTTTCSNLSTSTVRTNDSRPKAQIFIMSAYQIIDEPKPSTYHTLVVDPIVILFAALLVPLFFELPLYGRFWMPLAWIVLNGFLLGSPSKLKEAVIAIAGCVTFFALYSGIHYLSTIDLTMARFLYPYYQIIIQGALFFTLYVIVFYQSPPYAIHQYIKSSNRG